MRPEQYLINECHPDVTDYIEELEKAVAIIAPWLSASLSDPNHKSCKEYIDACNAVFEVDEDDHNPIRGKGSLDVEAGKLAKLKDLVIQEVISRALNRTDWSTEDIVHRGRWVNHHDGTENFIFDGECLIVFSPLKIAGDQVSQQYTVLYK